MCYFSNAVYSLLEITILFDVTLEQFQLSVLHFLPDDVLDWSKHAREIIYLHFFLMECFVVYYYCAIKG
jgi:hypothetical protein